MITNHPSKVVLSRLTKQQLYAYCAELRHQDSIVDEILWERRQKELKENPCIEVRCWFKGVFDNQTVLNAKAPCYEFNKCRTIYDTVRHFEGGESCLDGYTKEIVIVDGIVRGLFDEIDTSKPHKINIQIK